MAEKVKKTGKKKTGKKREKVNVPIGIAHILASFNNTVISITDMEGNLLASCSAGAVGFKGSRKGTPFAAQQAASNAANSVREYGMRTVQVLLKVLMVVQRVGIVVRVALQPQPAEKAEAGVDKRFIT